MNKDQTYGKTLRISGVILIVFGILVNLLVRFGDGAGEIWLYSIYGPLNQMRSGSLNIFSVLTTYGM
jgi:hypothetical protein